MKVIIQYLRQDFSDTNWFVTTAVTFYTGLLVFLNYYYEADILIRAQSGFFLQTVSWFLVFSLAFIIPYLLYGIAAKREYLSNPSFIFLAVIAPLIFAVRISIPAISTCTVANVAIPWLPVINWSASFIFILAALLSIWYHSDRAQPFYGLKKGGSLSPYLLMLAIMLPFIVWTSTMPGFNTMYPKLNLIEHTSPVWWEKLLFELSYGSDFFTIELFFRGFLVLAFAKWAGKDAILPMACFYCTIHFSKPLPECISSYFGGILLGTATYYSRSVWGGLVVHLGIAWAMEIAGYYL